jgi:putative flippase GtrA
MLQHDSHESDACAADAPSLPPPVSPNCPQSGGGDLQGWASRGGLPRWVLPYWPLCLEFFRYVLVGGGAFLVDIGVLQLSLSYLFQDLTERNILLATALGFIAGLICNYAFSCLFVFQKIDAKARQHKIRAFILFAGIGIIGLELTVLLMHFGILLAGKEQYIAVKIFTAGVVLMWNYLARKILIFKGAEWKTDVRTQ